ncbi:hypothetical protein [Pseudomonas putida]|uniref:hypothetical protein n=1 Tax=Pseudomonas putida TaxID=303 RepID=UPI000ADDD0F8|nr:hypothetical protein [Pseudomonas putida]
MTVTVNKHGLPRTIPADVKLQVRKSCGFGCVICGNGIVDYEHVEPEFKDARVHDPKGIALLCPGCHAMVTRKQWSKARVKLAMRSPASLQEGAVRQFFDFCEGTPALKMGETILYGCEVLIHFHGHDLFSVKPPEEEGSPFRLSGIFTDSAGNPTLEIIDNEWIASSSAWDIEVVGPRITIREGERNIALILKAEPPNLLVVEKLNMNLGGYKIAVSGDSFILQDRNGRTNTFVGGSISGRTALAIL